MHLPITHTAVASAARHTTKSRIVDADKGSHQMTPLEPSGMQTASGSPFSSLWTTSLPDNVASRIYDGNHMFCDTAKDAYPAMHAGRMHGRNPATRRSKRGVQYILPGPPYHCTPLISLSLSPHSSIRAHPCPQAPSRNQAPLAHPQLAHQPLPPPHQQQQQPLPALPPRPRSQSTRPVSSQPRTHAGRRP